MIVSVSYTLHSSWLNNLLKAVIFNTYTDKLGMYFLEIVVLINESRKQILLVVMLHLPKKF